MFNKDKEKSPKKVKKTKKTKLKNPKTPFFLRQIADWKKWFIFGGVGVAIGIVAVLVITKPWASKSDDKSSNKKDLEQAYNDYSKFIQDYENNEKIKADPELESNFLLVVSVQQSVKEYISKLTNDKPLQSNKQEIAYMETAQKLFETQFEQATNPTVLTLKAKIDQVKNIIKSFEEHSTDQQLKVSYDKISQTMTKIDAYTKLSSEQQTKEKTYEFYLKIINETYEYQAILNKNYGQNSLAEEIKTANQKVEEFQAKKIELQNSEADKSKLDSLSNAISALKNAITEAQTYFNSSEITRNNNTKFVTDLATKIHNVESILSSFN